MAKSEPSIEELSVITIEKMRADMIGTKYKLLNEVFVKAVDSGGKISPTDNAFQEQRSSLLNSDPDDPKNAGKAVISMLGFEKGSQEKIKKLVNKGAPKELFSTIESDTVALREELTSKLSTENGITELMSDLIIQKASEVIPFQVRITKKEGMYEPGDTRPTNNMETAELSELLTPAIVLPKSVTSALMTDITSIPNIVAPIFNKHMIEVFGQKGSDGILTLDKSKLTPENIEVFTKRVNNDLENIPTHEIVANSIVQDAIKKIEKEGGYKISESQAQKIVDKLSPALAQLDSEYLKKYSSVISGDIQKEILAKSTVTANIFGGVHIRESNLDKIADKLLDRHLDESDKYQIKIINDKLFGMKDSEVAAKLTDLGVEKAKASKYDVSLISDQDLAQMRKENPVQFDKVVFGKDNPVKNPKEVIDSVIDKAVDKLKTENGVKLSPKKEAYLRVKFKKELTPALSKLDPEYLKEQTDIISSNIQKDLYKNKSIGYSFGQEFSVATENLAKISESITTNYQQSSNQFEVDKVKTLLIDTKKTNTQFEKSLTDLAVEKAKGVVFKPKDLNPENLLEMRKENPARFDKVVLGVGKEKAPIVASKRLSAVEQAKEISTHISHPKPPLAPPPLLHPHEQVQR
ncbi:unnamed protein product [Rotaria magnacalcarata]|uniref:Uncharacterized protein n=1 Tax=Rotaria magnacalcarata TaxID=392030 RepID=A0A819AJR0_9BILA|nr:unnamed protein product [Rotaria magnacalcarata]CAF3786716.1 unnamed protein product [Rotaria magnacalcarata]